MKRIHTTKIVNALPQKVKNVLIADPGLCVAGGFCRAVIAGEAPRDIDIFAHGAGQIAAAAVELSNHVKDAALISSPRALTVHSPYGELPDVQFVLRDAAKDVNGVLESFDFTVCQFGVWHGPEDWFGTSSPEAYPDLAGKLLSYTGANIDNDPFRSLARAGKFMRLGYTLHPDSLGLLLGEVMLAANTSKEDASTFCQRAVVLSMAAGY